MNPFRRLLARYDRFLDRRAAVPPARLRQIDTADLRHDARLAQMRRDWEEAGEVRRRTQAALDDQIIDQLETRLLEERDR